MLFENFPSKVNIPEIVSDAGIGGNLYAWNYDDYNGDGLIDLFVFTGEFLSTFPDASTAAAIFLNDGNSGLSYDSSLITDDLGAIHPRKVVSGDLNGDGRPDILLADHGYDAEPFPGAAPVLLLSSEGGYVRASGLEDIVGFHHSVTTGDIDYDGDLDVFFTDNMDGNFFLINDGTGTFIRSYDYVPTQAMTGNYFTSELVDVDSDGYLDLIVAGHEFEGANTQVFWGSATAGYRNAPVTVLDYVAGHEIVVDIEVEDLNSDGLNDIILNRVGSPPDNYFYGPTPSFQILFGSEDRTFLDVTSSSMASVDLTLLGREWVSWLIADDLDNDGDLDLYIDDVWLSSDSFLNNDGSGKFTLVVPESAGSDSWFDSEAYGNIYLTGPERVGSPISVAHFIQDDDGPGEIVSYQWFKNGIPIASAVGPTYTPSEEDEGALIGLSVAYRDARGYETELESYSSYLVRDSGSANYPTISSFFGGDWLPNQMVSVGSSKADFTIKTETPSPTSIYLELSSESAEIQATDIYRFEFTDTHLALDFAKGQSAYNSATLIGTAFGGDYIDDYFAIGLSFFDANKSVAEIAQLIADNRLIEGIVGDSNEAWVAHVYENVTGNEPDEAALALYTGYLDNGDFTKAELLALAQSVASIEEQLGIVGLQSSGLEYTPVG